MTGILSWAVTVLFLLLLLWGILRYFAAAAGKCAGAAQSLCTAGCGRVPPGRVFAFVLFLFLLSRSLMWAGGLAGAAGQGTILHYLTRPQEVWTRWDAPHYLDLIRSGYTNEGEQRLFIVFFPMYPFLCRGLCLLSGLGAEASAYLVSNTAFLLSGICLFRLTEESASAEAAKRATALMMLSPLTVFCSVPYTESLFLLTSLLAVLMARRGRFLWAVAAGAVCSFTRLCGLAVAVPVFYELLRRRSGPGIRPVLRSVAAVLPVGLGLLAYLLLNRIVTGDALRFTVYQSEHWGQRAGSLHNTLSYTLKNAAGWSDDGVRYGTWIPQAAALITAPVVLALAARRSHPADNAFALICYYVSAIPTWLLSGPRYLTAVYAFYPIGAELFRRRGVFLTVCILAAHGCFAAGWMYSACGILL